ncbi:hypothetical protein H5410_062665, partial [Solanum commersonii]
MTIHIEHSQKNLQYYFVRSLLFKSALKFSELIIMCNACVENLCTLSQDGTTNKGFSIQLSEEDVKLSRIHDQL